MFHRPDWGYLPETTLTVVRPATTQRGWTYAVLRPAATGADSTQQTMRPCPRQP